ncbi:MAG: glycosyltransferase family 1 protein [Lentisphaerae bacterium]|nr:glycosyltransferase family 1 protein [Lentisphaerota bacterium]
MLDEFRILNGQSRYDVFAVWQEALAKAFKEAGWPVTIAPVQTPVPAGGRRVSFGFNLVRNWSRSAMTMRHVAWLVDHPVYHGAVLAPQISRLPVNLENCLFGSVDSHWTRFAAGVYAVPNLCCWPHATVMDSVTEPDWSGRRYDVVFFGSLESPDSISGELRRKAGAFTPVLEALLEAVQDRDECLDERVWTALRAVGREGDAARVALNVFFPLVDLVYRNRQRLRLLKAVRRPIHVFGSGPWRDAGLPDTIHWHDPVPYAEALRIMSEARIVINHTPTLHGGAHERIMDAIACGCYVFTTPSDFVESEFGGSGGLCVYRAGDAPWVGEKIDAALADPDSPARVAKAQKVLAARHRMRHRAKAIMEALRTCWPDVCA